MLRAFEVKREGRLVGYLGEAPGPFVFASSSPLGFPRLRHCRFTCVSVTHEDEVGSQLEKASSFDDAVSALKRARFVLSAVEHARCFSERGPVAGPEVSSL